MFLASNVSSYRESPRTIIIAVVIFENDGDGYRPFFLTLGMVIELRLSTSKSLSRLRRYRVLENIILLFEQCEIDILLVLNRERHLLVGRHGILQGNSQLDLFRPSVLAH